MTLKKIKHRLTALVNKITNKKVQLPLIDKALHDEIKEEVKTAKEKSVAEFNKCVKENDDYLKKLVNTFFKDAAGKTQIDGQIIFNVYNKRWTKYASNFNHT